MRGFDPASEDDMDDNGMSRYMENNDEKVISNITHILAGYHAGGL